MNKNLKRILVTGASLLMLASAGTGISNIGTNAHAAKLSNFPPGTAKTVRLTRSLRADNVYNAATTKLRVARHRTKLHRGEYLKVTLAESSGFGFNITNHKHPDTSSRGYSLPIKDAKYFKIVKKHAKKHIRRTRKHVKRYRRHGKRYTRKHSRY